MLTLTINCETPEELLQIVQKLNRTPEISGSPLVIDIPAPKAAPIQTKHADTPKIKEAAKPEAVKTTPSVVELIEAAGAAEPAPSAPNKADVMKAATTLVTALTDAGQVGRDTLIALLGEFGAKGTSDLAVENYAAFIERAVSLTPSAS